MNKAKIELFNFMLKEAEKLGISSDLLGIMTKALIMDEKGDQEECPRDPTAEMWEDSEDDENDVDYENSEHSCNLSLRREVKELRDILDIYQKTYVSNGFIHIPYKEK